MSETYNLAHNWEISCFFNKKNRFLFTFSIKMYNSDPSPEAKSQVKQDLMSLF